jgi:hypothetical protein
MIFSDEIINHILGFRENHPCIQIIGPYIKTYTELDNYIFEYYHDNEYYERSFIDWYFVYRKL